jgi:hypothetical protein
MSILATDNFQRANENPLSDGGNWSTIFGGASNKIVSQVCQASAGFADCGNYWSGITWPNDQSSKVSVNINVGSLSWLCGVILRVQPGAESFYLFKIDTNGIWEVSAIVNGGGGGGFFGSTAVVMSQMTLELQAQGSTFTALINGSVVGSGTDTTFSSGYPGLYQVPGSATLTNTVFTLWQGGDFSYSISGNTGAAGAAVNYSGTSSGSTTADGSGNFTISGLVNGNYTITPVLAGYSFVPVSHAETISGGNITGVNFTAVAPSVYSVPDARQYGNFPNHSRTVNNTVTYDVPSVDSRVGGAPTDSRASTPKSSGTYPQNSRTPGTYGPGE